MEQLSIGGREVGSAYPPYFIAEIGSNHNGDMQLCRGMIDAAKACGVDAVKFQSWSKDSIISAAEYARNTSYSDKKKHFGSLEKMVEKYQLTPEQHCEIFAYCSDRGITFLSSCFSAPEVDLLVRLGSPALKIASMDINNFVLLDYAARTKLPILLSTGMSTMSEITDAVAVLRSAGCESLILLHCISVYPAPYETINLRNILSLQTTFDVPIGFSDHSLGTAIPLAAIAVGACVIEKHFTVDKQMEGWDHAISADPEEMAIIVREGRQIHAALGSTERAVSDDELKQRKKMRRRVVIRQAMRKGEVLGLDELDFKRPGNGIHPNEVASVVGRSLKRDVEPDHELEWSDLA
jgi:N,N'-diacetyllegionaminate synthase